nr:MAG: hypothetical protein [Caudoviricetes sp.]
MKQINSSIVILVILLLVYIVSCGFIWSINTLFKLNVEYDFEHIAAAFLLLSFLSPYSNYSKK